MSLRDEIAVALEQDKWLADRTNAAAVPSHPRHQMMGGLLFHVQAFFRLASGIARRNALEHVKIVDDSLFY